MQVLIMVVLNQSHYYMNKNLATISEFTVQVYEWEEKNLCRYKYLVLGRDKSYFVKDHSDSNKKFSETDIKMLDFLIDNIFVTFGGRVFQQTVGIPMGTNCAPLLADLFLYYYEADFIQELLRKKNKKLAISFNFTFRYIDDVLSLNN